MRKSLLLALMTAIISVTPAWAADTFVVASDATWPPFEMLDDDKNVVGYGPEYAREVGKQIGLQADVRNIAWDGIFAALGSRQCDVIVSSVTITPERQQTMAFTIPYFENYQAVVVPKGAAISSMADLKGRTVGGQIGTTGILYTQRLNEEQNLGAIIKTYDEVGLAMEDMKNGRLDSVICDDRVALYYAEKNPGYTDVLKMAFVTEEVEYYGFALRKQDTELLEKLNKGILAVKDQGIEAQLQAKWFD